MEERVIESRMKSREKHPQQHEQRSMSDTGSMDSQFDSFHSFHSPNRSDPPLHSDDPEPPPRSHRVVVSDWLARGQEEEEEEVGPTGGEEGFGSGGDLGREKSSRAAVAAILRRSRREAMVKRAELGLRICEVVLCLISLSVMIADKTRGWSQDSFYRYKEYRYCVAVTIIGCIYSGLQACYLSYRLITGKHVVVLFHHICYHFDFAMDQILAYLVISASSSAATRVDDWASYWGEDEFTEMAAASIGISFLAFAAFSLSSLISGYKLCNYISP